MVLECVPNFSEGRDKRVIAAIADAIRNVSGVQLLHVDSGEAANRTVYTFAGDPDGVVEAAFAAIKTASLLIDMSCHHGEHPRIGAADVVPLVPVSGMSLEDAAVYAKKLSLMVSQQLGIPVYAYEASAVIPERKKLEYCRKGEYEGLATNMRTPDFGPTTFTDTVRRSGASVIGVRQFLLAVNFNLNSRSKEIASLIAADVRESGRRIDAAQWEKDTNGLWSRIPGAQPSGEIIHIPGILPGCKAIGWYIEEYGLSQVSMNVTDMCKTPLWMVFEKVSEFARLRGVRVTGTEIIGLLPLKALTDSGKHYLSLQGINDSDEDLQVWTAVRSMSLEDLPAGFDPQKRIIEYLLK